MSAKPLHFTGPKHLLGWLRGHAVGESVLHEAMVPLCEDCRVSRRPVLLILHPDGIVEMHCQRKIDIRVVNAYTTETPTEELWQMHYIFHNLPRSHQAIYQGPVFCPIGKCQPKTKDDEIARLQGMIFLRDLRAWKQRYRESFGTEAIDEIARDVKVTMLG
jgi:hypothetical protein